MKGCPSSDGWIRLWTSWSSGDGAGCAKWLIGLGVLQGVTGKAIAFNLVGQLSVSAHSEELK